MHRNNPFIGIFAKQHFQNIILLSRQFFIFDVLIYFDIFLDGTIGELGAPPPPPAFFAGASSPGSPRLSHSNHERCSNSKTVLFGRVVALKLVSVDKARKIMSNALVKRSNGLLVPELWPVPDACTIDDRQ